MDFEIVLIGTDINCYYMARNTHEAYNKKAYVIGKEPMKFTSYSKIINLQIEPRLHEKEVFIRVLEDFALKHEDKKLILIPTNDNYVRLIIENKEFLKKYYLFNDISEDLMNSLLVKDKFYEVYEDSLIDLPETYIYDINDELDLERVSKLGLPIIVKPGDGVSYHHHEFENQAKVYKLKSMEELISVVKQIKDSKYNGTLILQKFISGDDSYLCDVIFYCDHTRKCKLMTFAQIGLQERTITGVGNCTVLVNGYCNLGPYGKTVEQLREFIDTLDYQGFAEIDLKYDEDDQKFKVLEINPRQARSSYYLTPCGYNIVKYIVNDLLYKKELEFEFIDQEVCLSFVPKKVIDDYVLNRDLKDKINELIKQKRFYDPLDYSKDNLLKRKVWLSLRKLNYIKKYKENNW